MPTIVAFTPNPPTIALYQVTTLAWTVTGATSLSIDNGVGTVTGNNSQAISPTQTTTYTLTASNAAGSVTAKATVTVNVQVTISPTTIVLLPGTTQQFTATVAGSSNTLVSWSVVEASGGSITADGNYSAPAKAGTYHVKATSQADSTISSEAAVTVDVIGVSIAPSSANLITNASQNLTATVTGATKTSSVTWGVVEPNGGTIVDNGNDTATYTASGTAGTFHVLATSTEDPSRSATIPITVTKVTLTISPQVVTLVAGATQQFTATVGGTSNTTVNWAVVEQGGGTITSAGLYTAPTTSGTYHLKATSQVDPTLSSEATVTVDQVGVTISPTTITLNQGATQTFTASVSGASLTSAVTWQVQETGGGSIVAQGNSTAIYTAPTTAGTFHAIAYSVEDPTKSATATVTVNPAPTFDLALSSQSLAVQQGATGNITVNVNPLDGFAGTVSFTSINPTGTAFANVFTPTSSATSTSLGITVPATQAIGTYNLTVTGTCGAIVVSKTVQVVVTANPTYTLTVTLGTGVTGTPNVTTTYAQGSVVNYNYTLATGYQNLVVAVDGTSAAASGSVTMNGNHVITVTATPVTYTVTFVAGAGGTLTGPTTQTVAYGGTCTGVTAVPSNGNAFSNWTGTGFATSTANPLTVTNVTSNLTITANFTQNTYTVTFLAGTGGTLTGGTTQTVAAGGSSTAVTAVPSAGYAFATWTGAGFTTSAANPITVTNVTSNMTITANFTQNTYTVTFLAGNGGTLNGNTTQTVAAGGSSTAVTAVPNTGFTLSNWTGSGFGTTTANPLTVTNVTSNMVITANFTQSTYTVTFVAGTGGTLTGTTTQTIAAGGSSTAVAAVPNTGYAFTTWTGVGFTTSATNPLTVTNVTSNMTISANFTQNTYTVTFLAGAGGTLAGTTTQTIAAGGSSTAVAAVPNTGYAFTTWTGVGFTTSATNPLTVTNVTSNMTISANFTQNTYTVTFVAGTGGTLAGTTTQTVAAGGSCTPVTAVPNTGFAFTTWTGAGFAGSTSNPLTVTNVTSNMTITANFSQSTYTVTFVAGAGGTMTGTTFQTVAAGGSCTAVIAVPNTGYAFSNWTGSGGFATSSSNPLTVSGVTSNMTITANFTPSTYTVTFVAGTGGTLTGTTTQTVASGGSCTAVTAVPGTGYIFYEWTGSAFRSVSNPLTVTNVVSNMTIAANFIQNPTVTFVAGRGGTLTGTTFQTVAAGGSCTAVTAVPNTGFVFSSWTGPGFATSTSNPLTVTNVTSNLTITANFTPTSYTVTFVAGFGGSLTGATTQTVGAGGSCTAVTAWPATGYALATWTGSGFVTSTSNPLIVTNVTSNLTITANFSQTFTVTFVVYPQGTVLGSTTQTVAAGGSCTSVTAVPNTGYAFSNWTGPGFTTSTSNPLTVTNVTSNMTITANFTPITYTVTFVAGAGGTLTGTTTQTVPYGGSCTPVTAVPNTGYALANWTGSGFASSSNPLTVTNVPSNLTITANFTQGSSTVIFVDGTGGTVLGTTIQTVAPGGSCTAVTAWPNTGYAFVSWTGTGFTTSTSQTLTVTNVTSNMTITANFTPITYTVTFVAGAGGTLTGTTTQTIPYGGSCTPVTAVPNTGYSFSNWTGSGSFVTTGSNPLIMTGVISNMTITANF